MGRRRYRPREAGGAAQAGHGRAGGLRRGLRAMPWRVGVLLCCLATGMLHGADGDEWSRLVLVGAEAKLVLPEGEAGTHNPRGGVWVPAVAVGGGYRWFESGDRVGDAPYVRLGLTWPALVHPRLGLEAFADYSDTDLRYRRWSTETILVPDPENPNGPPLPQQRRVARRCQDSGAVWQLGAGLRPLLVRAGPGNWRMELAGRLGASVTVLDFDPASEVAPGAYAGIAFSASPWERLSLGVDVLLHWLDSDDIARGSLLTGSVGLGATIAF